MTAIDQLSAFYDDPEEFTRDIDAHLLHGYCYITPHNLALARPVCSHWTRDDIGNPLKIPGLTDSPDCWYVWAAIGDLDFLLSLIPYELPLISFARRKHSGHYRPSRTYPFHEIRRSRSTQGSPAGLRQIA